MPSLGTGLLLYPSKEIFSSSVRRFNKSFTLASIGALLFLNNKFSCAVEQRNKQDDSNKKVTVRILQQLSIVILFLK
jgi:hypothetical protein